MSDEDRARPLPSGKGGFCSDGMFQCQELTATASPGPALLAAELAAAAAASISAW